MNPFDTLNGCDNLDGIGRRFKKIGRKFDRARRKIEKKVIPKPVLKARDKVFKEVQRSKIAQTALVTVASIYGTPAAGTALKAAMAGVNVRKGVISAKNAKRAAIASQKYAAAINEKSPQFDQLISTMRAQGKTDNQILDAWGSSNSFVATSKTAVGEAVDNDVYTYMRGKGYTQEQADVVAPLVSDQLTTEAVAKIVPPSPLPLFAGAGLLLSFLL